MTKGELKVRLMGGLYGLSMDTADVVADYIIARETAMIDEIEKPLNMYKIFGTQEPLPKIVGAETAIDEALSIIQRIRGEK